MNWQATELNNAWRFAFMGLVRKHPAFAGTEAQLASIRSWNAVMTLLDKRLALTGAYVGGATFTLADIVLALSTNRWEMSPMHRPDLPSVKAWMDRIASRPGFLAHCRNGAACHTVLSIPNGRGRQEAQREGMHRRAG